MAFLISNPLMLSTPFKALAETCEADNSVFNMNMPLLLSVALKGKIVGGKVLLASFTPLVLFLLITLQDVFKIYQEISFSYFIIMMSK